MKGHVLVCYDSFGRVHLNPDAWPLQQTYAWVEVLFTRPQDAQEVNKDVSQEAYEIYQL